MKFNFHIVKIFINSYAHICSLVFSNDYRKQKKSFHRNKIISLMVVGFLGVFLNFDFSLKYHLCFVDSGEFF